MAAAITLFLPTIPNGILQFEEVHFVDYWLSCWTGARKSPNNSNLIRNPFAGRSGLNFPHTVRMASSVAGRAYQIQANKIIRAADQNCHNATTARLLDGGAVITSATGFLCF